MSHLPRPLPRKTFPIVSFSGEFAFLSNFYMLPKPLRYVGREYPTVEHAFQAAKTVDENWKETIRRARTAGDAKRLGQKVPLIPAWEQLKEDIMHDLLVLKFKHNPLRARLIGTCLVELVEGNSWGDTYWGVCPVPKKDGSGSRGLNRLGQLLMQVREEIRHGKET